MNYYLSKTTVLSLFAFLTTFDVEASNVVRRFYMSPTSSATVRDGTEQCPFHAFEEAQKAVRESVSDSKLKPGIVEVVLEDGIYVVSNAIEFCQKDSGTTAHPVRWRSRHRLGAHISGGLEIPPFRKLQDKKALGMIPSVARKHVMVSDLSEKGIAEKLASLGWNENLVQAELVCEGNVQTLSRWPNSGYTAVAKSPGVGHWHEKNPRVSQFCYEDNRITRWSMEREPRANGYFFHDWASDDVAIKRIDPSCRMIEVDEDGWRSGFPAGYSLEGIWYGYNLLCELDSPGEYYLDRVGQRLYFWPGEGLDIKSCQLTHADGIIKIRGDLSNVTFAGLVFENCRGDAIYAKSTHAVSFIACEIKNVGRRAFVDDHAWRTTLVGCDVHDCGAGGIRVCGGVREKLIHANTSIENCHIHHYSTRALSYAAAVELGGCGFRLIHNTIHNGPYWAIKLDGPENEIVSNEIHSVCLDCGEMGAIYAYKSWLLCGSLIAANYIHDIYNPRYERNRGIMLDGASAGVSIISNVFENVAQGVSAHSIGNKIKGNVFVNCKPPIAAWHTSLGKNAPEHVLRQCEGIPVDRSPWKDRYPWLLHALTAIKNGSDRPPSVRTQIKNNITTEKDLVLYTKWASYSPQEWDVSDNTVSARRDALKKRMAFVNDVGVYPAEQRAVRSVIAPITIKCKRLVDERGASENGRFLPAKGNRR